MNMEDVRLPEGELDEPTAIMLDRYVHLANESIRLHDEATLSEQRAFKYFMKLRELRELIDRLTYNPGLMREVDRCIGAEVLGDVIRVGRA